MKKTMTIGQQLAIGFALPTIILIVLAAVTYNSTQRLMDTSYWVNHTQQVLTEVTGILSDIKDVETGQRGYIITGKDEYLEPYKTGLESIPRRSKHLVELVSDSQQQTRRLEELEPLIQARIKLATSAVAARKAHGLEGGVEEVVAGNGKRLMDDVRRVVDDMVAHENELLRLRAQDSENASTNLTRILIGGTIAAILLVVGAATFIIRRLGMQIGGVVQRMRSAGAELEAASTQQVKGAKEQASATAEVATTMRELVTTSRQIADNAQRVTQLSNEMSTSARSGDQTVAGAREAIDMVRRQVDQIVGHMLALGKKSQDIGGILEIINELAEQTNILAINATIEAVGAGEAGKRFGVFAGEIRKLADRVSASTKDIRRLIEEIRTSANTTVMATEDGAKAVEAGTRRFGDVTESFRRIAEHIAGTTQASREIELSTKQQTSAMEQVSSAMIETAQTARESEASSAQVQQTATELTTMSSELLRLIQSGDEQTSHRGLAA